MPPVGGWPEGDETIVEPPIAPEVDAQTDRRGAAQFIRDGVASLADRYDSWLDGMQRRNPEIERGRMSVLAGVAGGLAVLAAVKVGPDVLEHTVAAIQNPKPGIKDIGSFLLTTSTAYAAGMHYLDSRNARKHARMRHKTGMY